MSLQSPETPNFQQVLNEVEEVPLPLASDGIVDLPGGWISPTGEVCRKAVIRELSGADEEALSRATRKGGVFDPVLFLNTALERGLVSIDGHQATPEMRNSLLIGDRDAILMAVRIATYGSDYEAGVKCPQCAYEGDVVFELDRDVEYRTIDAPRWWWDVPLRNGRSAKAHLVTVVDQQVGLKEESRTAAEVDTIIMSRVVESVDGVPVLGPQSLLQASAGDRRAISRWLVENQPGPKLGEVKGCCPACKTDFPYPLSLPALFL